MSIFCYKHDENIITGTPCKTCPSKSLTVLTMAMSVIDIHEDNLSVSKLGKQLLGKNLDKITNGGFFLYNIESDIFYLSPNFLNSEPKVRGILKSNIKEFVSIEQPIFCKEIKNRVVISCRLLTIKNKPAYIIGTKKVVDHE